MATLPLARRPSSETLHGSGIRRGLAVPMVMIKDAVAGLQARGKWDLDK